MLQETFAYLFRRLPPLRPEVRLTTLLYPAVKNLALQQVRKRKRYLPFGDREAQIPAPRVSDDSELAAVVRSLPEGQREVVILRFVDDWSFDEIADALGIPAGTVKSRLHNALRTLREDPHTQRYFGRR